MLLNNTDYHIHTMEHCSEYKTFDAKLLKHVFLPLLHNAGLALRYDRIFFFPKVQSPTIHYCYLVFCLANRVNNKLSLRVGETVNSLSKWEGPFKAKSLVPASSAAVLPLCSVSQCPHGSGSASVDWFTTPHMMPSSTHGNMEWPLLSPFYTAVKFNWRES